MAIVRTHRFNYGVRRRGKICVILLLKQNEPAQGEPPEDAEYVPGDFAGCVAETRKKYGEWKGPKWRMPSINDPYVRRLPGCSVRSPN